jgi:hypothetical protein
MKMTIQFLTSKIKYIVLIYVVIQLILILTIDISYKSDSLYYYKLAQECSVSNEYYPAKAHLYEDYIVAPLYINVLIILLKSYNSTILISFFNLATVLLTIFILFKITSQIFSIYAAQLTILLYILYLNTSGLVIQNYTDLFFLFLILTSIYLYSLRTNFALFLSGTFIGASIAVRPVGWALLLAFILIHFVSIIKKSEFSLNRLFLYTGTIIFIVTFGLFTYSHFGRFEFTSTTGPINLLLGANDDATGGFNSRVLETGKTGFIDDSISMTYIQRGEFYQEQAFSWIEHNPEKWLLLAPMKIFHTFTWDDISLSALLGFDDTNFARVIRIILTEGDLNKALPDSSVVEKFIYLLILVISHIYFFFLTVVLIIGVYNYFKLQESIKAINLILMFCALAILMIMVTVGAPRYKYPVIILLMPFAANYLAKKFKIVDANK